MRFYFIFIEKMNQLFSYRDLSLHWFNRSITASQITSRSTICSTACLVWHQENIKTSVTGPCEVNPSVTPHKRQVTRKTFQCHHVALLPLRYSGINSCSYVKSPRLVNIIMVVWRSYYRGFNHSVLGLAGEYCAWLFCWNHPVGLVFKQGHDTWFKSIPFRHKLQRFISCF